MTTSFAPQTRRSRERANTRTDAEARSSPSVGASSGTPAFLRLSETTSAASSSALEPNNSGAVQPGSLASTPTSSSDSSPRTALSSSSTTEQSALSGAEGAAGEALTGATEATGATGATGVAASEENGTTNGGASGADGASDAEGATGASAAAGASGASAGAGGSGAEAQGADQEGVESTATAGSGDADVAAVLGTDTAAIAAAVIAGPINLLPAFAPAPPARLGGTQAPIIPNPPKLAAEQAKAVRSKSGLTPDEHHDRIRARVDRLARKASRSQVRVVRQVEITATKLLHRVFTKSRGVDRFVQSGCGLVSGSVSRAIQDINRAIDNTVVNINAHDTTNSTGVDTAEATTIENIEAAVAEAGTAINDAYAKVMSKYDSSTSNYQTLMKDVPGELKPSLATTLKGLASTLIASTSGTVLERYVDERRGVNIPAIAPQAQADLDSGGRQRGLQLVSQETRNQFALQFLQLVDPAQVAEDEVADLDARGMATGATHKQSRLASARERAIKTVEGTRTSSTEQLRTTERQLNSGLLRAGNLARQSLQAQAYALENDLKGAAGPYAQSYRAFMQRIRALFPKGQFLELEQFLPNLMQSEEELDAMPGQQLDVVADRRKGMEEQADKSFDERTKQIRKMATTGAASVSTSRDDTIAGVERVGIMFIDHQTEDANEAIDAADPHATASSENLRAFAGRIEEAMINALTVGVNGLPSINSNFQDQVDRFKAYCENVRDTFNTFAAEPGGLYTSVDDATRTDLNARSLKIHNAAEDTTLGFSSTDEDAMFDGLTGLSRRGMAALEHFFEHEKNFGNLWNVVSGELADDADEQRAGENLILGNNAEAVEYLVRSSDHWYGRNSERAINALRSLNAEERAELEALPGWESARQSLLGDLHGTRLEIANAYLAGDRVLAVTLQIDERLQRARAQANENAVVDGMMDMDRMIRQDLAFENRTALVEDASVLAFQNQVYREHAVVRGGMDRQELANMSGPEGDRRAADMFIQHTTRTFEVYVSDGEGGGHTEERRLSEPARAAVEDIVHHGANSPVAQGTRLAYEHSRGSGGLSESRIERIHNAAEDRTLYEARRAYERAVQSGNQAVIESARSRLDRAEAAHTEFVTSYARRLNAPAEVLADPARAQSFAADSMAGLFEGEGHWGQRFARELITEGRPGLLSSTMLATDKTGTHETLLRLTYADREASEFDQLRRDYATEVAGDPNDLNALDRHLGTFGHGSWGELSGDDRQDIELLMLGREDTDAARARVAFYRYRHEVDEIGGGGRASMAGTVEGRNLAERRERLEALIDAAVAANHGEGPAFDAEGRPNPAAFDPNSGQFLGAQPSDWREFRNLTIDMRYAAEAYRAELDRQESFIVGVIQAIGAVVAIALMFVPGVNILVAGVIAAVLTGLATMAVKSDMRGQRYGWEEAVTDLAMTGVDAATAALGGAKFLRFATLGKVGGAMAREAVTGAIGSMAHVALQDDTWHDGFAAGLLRTAGGGLRGALVGAVSAGVSESVSHGIAQRLKPPEIGSASALQSFGRRVGERGRAAIADGIGESVGSMLGETTGIGFDAARGTLQGGLEDNLARIGLAGVRDLFTGGARAAMRTRNRARYDDLRRQLLAQPETPSPVQLRQLRLAGISAGEPGLFTNDGFARLRGELAVSREILSRFPPDFRADVASLPLAHLMRVAQMLNSGERGSLRERRDLLSAIRDHGVDVDLDLRALDERLQAATEQTQQQRQRERRARGIVLSGIPREMRGALARLPLAGLELLPAEALRRVADFVAQGSRGTPAQRAELLRMARAADPDVDAHTLLRNLDAAVQSAQVVRDVARDDRRRALKTLPPDARRAFAALPPSDLARALAFVRQGEAGTPAQRAALARAAAAADPRLDARSFLVQFDSAVGATRLAQREASAGRREARQARLADQPPHLRSTLALLPDAALDTLRLLQIRGSHGTPQERAELLRQVLAENPDADPHVVLRAVDDAVAGARQPTVGAQFAGELRRTLLSSIPEAMRAAFGNVPITVLSAERFVAFTRSSKGDAVTLIIDGRPHVVLREGADPRVLHEEAEHLMQMRDPAWARRVGVLDERQLANWDQLPLAEQLALYRNKVEIEVDAQERLLARLNGQMSNADADIVALHRQADAAAQALSNLRRLRDQARGIGRVQSAGIALGLVARPQWLDQPARLFSKGGVQTPRPRAPADRAPALRHDGEEHHTVGYVQRSDGEVMAQLVRAGSEVFVRPHSLVGDSVETNLGNFRLLNADDAPRNARGEFAVNLVRNGTVVVDAEGIHYVVVRSTEKADGDWPVWRLRRLDDPGVIEVPLRRLLEQASPLSGQFVRGVEGSVSIRLQNGEVQALIGGNWQRVDVDDLQGTLVRQSTGEYQDMLIPRSDFRRFYEHRVDEPGTGLGRAGQGDVASAPRADGAIIDQRRGLASVPAENVELVQVNQAMRLVSEMTARLRDATGPVRMMMIRLSLNEGASIRDRMVLWIASALLGVPPLRGVVDRLLQRFPQADKDLTRRLVHEFLRHDENDFLIGNPAFAAFRKALTDAYPRLAAELRDDLGVGTLDPHIFNHIKTIAVAEFLMMTTASMHANNKLDTAIHVRDPQLVEHFGEWMRLIGQPATAENILRRQELVAEMGRRGYQVNDPSAERYNAATAVNALISDTGPGGRLTLYIKELQDMEVARRLVEQARSGVQIDFTLYSIDPSIQRYLAGVLADEPNLPLVIRKGTGEPKFHGNVIVSEYQERTQAFAGTNYLWFNQNTPISPSGVSFEAGVLLQGAHAKSLLEQSQSSRERLRLSSDVLIGPAAAQTPQRYQPSARDAADLRNLGTLLRAGPSSEAISDRLQHETEIANLLMRLGASGPSARARLDHLRSSLDEATLPTDVYESLLLRALLSVDTDTPRQQALRLARLRPLMDAHVLGASARRALLQFLSSQTGPGMTGREVLREVQGLTTQAALPRLLALAEAGSISTPLLLKDNFGRQLEIWVGRDGAGVLTRVVPAGPPRGDLTQGGFAKGVSAAEIEALNRSFGGTMTRSGSPDAALVQSSRYEGFYRKSAALLLAIAYNRMFDNGNERTAHAVYERLRIRNGISTGVAADEVQRIILRIAEGQLLDVEQIARALRGF